MSARTKAPLSGHAAKAARQLTGHAAKAARQKVVHDLLAHGGATSQDELVVKLGAAGHRVTQATVSRDLEELGAVRRREGDHFVYALPEHNGPPVGWGVRILSDGITDVASSGNLVVVRTFPGLAPTVGALLDTSGITGVLGTVAGDDTVLVVAAEGHKGSAVADRIRNLGEQDS